MIRLLAALGGLLAVGFGAFGAHVLTSSQAKAWVATGATYGLAHAVAGLWGAEQHRWSALLWVIGALLFSGSLYALALEAPRSAAMAAPAGGTLMLGGWLWLLVELVRRRD